MLLLVLFYVVGKVRTAGRAGLHHRRTGRTAGLSGFDFEISETACFHDLGVSVFVSKAGEKKKALLFKYTPYYVGPYPIITSIGEHAIQISVLRVSSIFCRKEKWETLTVKYDIGVIEYPGKSGEPDEC